MVPEYLSELPVDPYYEQPFIYRLGTQGEGGGYWLYTNGPDLSDDGGGEQDIVYRAAGRPLAASAFEYLRHIYGN